MISFRPSAKFDQHATIVYISEEQLKSKKFSFSESTLKKQVDELAACGQFQATDGQIFPVLLKKKVCLLVGVGKKDDISLPAFRILARKVLLSSFLKNNKNIEVILHDTDQAIVKAFIDGAVLGTYRWRKYKTPSKKDPTEYSKKIALVVSKKKEFEDAAAICGGTNLARDLVNDNADTVTSTFLEKTIRAIVKGNKNVTLEILNKKELKAKGLGLHLAVNQGSTKEPKLIIVKYQGAGKSADYTALVGKGLTFDTGGLNLKPTGAIETMKMDMGGAATVIGTLKNIIDLKVKRNVIFAVGAAENVTGSISYKPGDIIVGYAGKTVEVANTDAEGRLVLADAISYIVKNYKPERLIDIATLTGACIVALGYDYTGLVTTDDKFSRQLVQSSNETDDRVWRLPSYPELKDSVKSQIADIRNLGFPKGAGGTITAAEFLRQFTQGTTWAHLDIAGTSFVENGGRMYFGHGATGAGVRLLTHYLQNNS